jgi:hypothetical protein
MKSNSTLAFAVSLAVAITVILFLGACKLTTDSDSAIMLREGKLAELNFEQKGRAGHAIQILVEVPRAPSVLLQFRGQVLISQSGVVLENYPVGSDDMEKADWFSTSPDLQAYILTWRKDIPAIGDRMEDGQTYQFKVKFVQAPPNGSSLWLRWVTL